MPEEKGKKGQRNPRGERNGPGLAHLPSLFPHVITVSSYVFIRLLNA